jgi:hypothetical protein
MTNSENNEQKNNSSLEETLKQIDIVFNDAKEEADKIYDEAKDDLNSVYDEAKNQLVDIVKNYQTGVVQYNLEEKKSSGWSTFGKILLAGAIGAALLVGYDRCSGKNDYANDLAGKANQIIKAREYRIIILQNDNENLNDENQKLKENIQSYSPRVTLDKDLLNDEYNSLFKNK